MNKKAGITGSIAVNTITFMPESEYIPKLAELYDENLRVVRRNWYHSKRFVINNISPGNYTLRISLSSGVQKDEYVEVSEGDVSEVQFMLAEYSPHESHEWAFLNKNVTVHAIRGTNMKNFDFHLKVPLEVSCRMYRLEGLSWVLSAPEDTGIIRVNDDGFVMQVNTGRILSVMEVTCGNSPKLFVSIPPAYNVKILIRPSENRNEYESPIDVTVSTEDIKMETILTLLMSGNLAEAKSLSNAINAEELLYAKMSSPAAAAVGGYFLLKIGDLSRMHNWARNLADWFSWLPDGSIIYATQLLSKREKTEEDLREIRNHLLLAARSGVPVYSYGLRLLDKGLTQLWYSSGMSDNEVGQARDKVGEYLEAADLTQETTTYTGILPDAPHRGRVENVLFVPDEKFLSHS